MFTTWEMPEGATFPDIESFEPLAAKFTTLWYSSDMGKQWQSNAVFHTYYLQLKRAIEVVPRMTPNTLHRFRPLMKFHAQIDILLISLHADESKEELQSYYKLTEEDLEEITKDWLQSSLSLLTPQNCLIPELIGSPEATREEHDTPGTNRRKKIEEVQNLSSASEETTSESPGGGGNDEVDKEENNGKEDQQKQGEVTPPRDPVDETDPSKKRKVSPMKPISRKKSRASKTKLQTVLMLDDFDFIIAAVSDASQDILQNNEAKQEAMYDRIETELRGVQQALHSSRAVSTVPPPSEEPELGDEPAQLLQNSRCDRSSPSSCPRRKGTGHGGPEASTRSGDRETQDCAAGEGFPPVKIRRRESTNPVREGTTARRAGWSKRSSQQSTPAL
jgi:hypothetical protein